MKLVTIRSCLLIISLVLLSTASSATTISPAIWSEDFGPTYSASQYMISGTATRVDGALRLSPESPGVAGRIACVQEYNPLSFRMSFRFRIVDSDGIVGDGIVFHWYPALTPAMFPGGELGWVHSDTAGFGLELDSRSAGSDPAFRHVALLERGTDNHIASAEFPAMSDGNWHAVQFGFDNGMAQVWVDGSEILSALIPVEDGLGYVMISGATGTDASEHWIDDIMFQSAIGPPRVTSPNGGELWDADQWQTVTWARSGLADHVRIELNRSFPVGEWTPLTASTPDTGAFRWLATGPQCSAARIRILSVENPVAGDTSDGDFGIQAPQVSVVIPNGGETWFIGSSRSVQWQSANVTGDIRIELKRDYPNGPWEILGSGAPNNGWFDWVVAGLPTTAARIRVTSVASPAVSDTSDSDFVIAERVVINEILYDTPGTDDPDQLFTELWGMPGLDISGWTLVGINGNGTQAYRTVMVPEGTVIPSNGYLVLGNTGQVPNVDVVVGGGSGFGVDWQNAGATTPDCDGLELRNAASEVVDHVCYGTCAPSSFCNGEGGSNAPDAAPIGGASVSLGRLPDHQDTDNNANDWYGLTLLTPGNANGGEACVAHNASLAQLRLQDASGVPVLKDSFVVVQGVANVDNYVFDDSVSYFFMQDDDAGISVYNLPTPTMIAAGDLVEVAGWVSQYNGLTELASVGACVATPRVEVLFQIGVPQPVVVTCNAAFEAFEGMLVRINDVSITSGTWPSAGSDANLIITDGTGVLTLRIDRDTDIDGTAQPSGTFDVTGILGQFDTTMPFTGEYQIMPRCATDLALQQTPPATVDIMIGSGPDWLFDHPLTEDCTPTGPGLPDGRVIRIFWDSDGSGADSLDPEWPLSNCNWNTAAMNGEWCIGLPGFYYSGCEGTWQILGVPAAPADRYFLKVYRADGVTPQYVSATQTLVPGYQEHFLPFADWTCGLNTGVTFQVNMAFQQELGLFDPATQDVVVRGDFNAWSGNDLVLALDHDSVYIGVFEIPIGYHEYKFVVVGGSPDLWESRTNRELTVGNDAIILPEVWFDDQPPVPVADVEVNFRVDMTVQQFAGRFDPAADWVVARGAHPRIGWWGGATRLYEESGNPGVFSQWVQFDRLALESPLEYKFVVLLNANVQTPDWEYLPLGANRSFTPTGSEPDLLPPPSGNGYGEIEPPLVYFSDTGPDDILQQDVNVVFRVDMRPAYRRIASEDYIVDPSTSDTIRSVESTQVAGFFNYWPWGNIPQEYWMNDSGIEGDQWSGDSVWSRNLLFAAGSPKRLEYSYGLNQLAVEAGYGRNHVVQLPDGGTTVVLDVDCYGSPDTLFNSWPCSSSSFLSLLSPNGGETRVIGESREITWTSTVALGSVRLELNRAYPSDTWEVIAGDIPNGGSYWWTVSGPVTDAARIRITSLSDPAVGDTSDADFSISLTRRIVLYEGFVNASCGPCAAAGPATHAMLRALGPDTVAAIWYHTWWPGTDPMYSWNVPENRGRINFYGVAGTPHAIIDGTLEFTPTANAIELMRTAIRDRHAVQFPGAIALSASTSGTTTVSFDAAIQVDQTIPGNSFRAFVALITDSIRYATPPGSNGETLFPYVFRDMWPDTNGWPVQLQAGQPINVSGALNRDAAWQATDLRVVAFVQNYNSQEILESVIASVSAGSLPPITLTYPNGGESVGIGEPLEIRWSAPTISDELTVELNRAYPVGEWETIAASTPNTGSLSWTATEPSTSDARIRVVSAIDPTVGDTSDADFSISSRYLAGTTWYDYQHNGSAGKMISVDSVGFVHVVWMNGLNSSNSARHVFYNVWDPFSSNFMFPGGLQVNPSSRAGYACQVTSSDGFCYPAYHEIPGGQSTSHAAAALDFLPRIGAFTSSGPAYIYENSNPLQLIWPKIAQGMDGRLHMISTESPADGLAGTPQRMYYSRGEPIHDASGQGVEIQWETVGPAGAEYLLLDTVMTISADIACSKTSSRSVMVWAKSRDNLEQNPTQYNNDIYMAKSEDGGLTWGAHINLTQFAGDDSLRAYTDCSVLFDADDNIHVAFTTIYFDESGQVLDANHGYIWHWSENTQEFSFLADGYLATSDWTQGPGRWQRSAQRPSLACDPVTGHLYCSYQRYDSLRVSQSGWPQGDAFISVSTDGGVRWSIGTNVTNATHLDYAPAGQCESIRDITIADRLTHVGGVAYVHMEYIMDRDAGGSPQNEGVTTLNPVYYQRIPVNQIATAPLMPQIPLHVNPPAATGFVTVEAAGPAEWNYRLNWLSGALSQLTFTGVCPGTAGFVTGEALAAGWTVTYAANSVTFEAASPLTWGSLSGFVLTHPSCMAQVAWTTGASSGSVAGPAQLQLVLTRPVGGENFSEGWNESITWTSQNLAGDVAIELNRVYPTGPWEPIVSSTPNVGTYSWLVIGPATTSARVRIMSVSMPALGDTSDADFSIVGSVEPSDSLYYDDGNPAFYYPQQNYWVSARFTPLSQFELGSISFFSINGSGNVSVCSVFVHSAVGDEPGPLLAAMTLSGIVENFAWNAVSVPTPLLFEPGQEFTIVIGPNPGGLQSQGWHVVMDNSNTDGRSRYSTSGHYGSYAPASGDFMIRARGESISEAPSLVLLSPNGGETLLAGTTDSIRWGSWNLGGNIDIRLNRNFPGPLWESLASNMLNQGVLAWPVTLPATSTARVSVSSVNNPAIADTSSADFSITEPVISLLSPIGGEVLPVGSQTTISWTSLNLNQEIRIELDRDYPSGSWITIAASTPNVGAYAWSVPGPATSTCRVRLIAVNNSIAGDTSDADFSIVSRAVTVVAPHGGESLAIGEEHQIQWSSEYVTGNVNVELNRAYPSPLWEPIGVAQASAGSLSWITNYPSAEHARVRVNSVDFPSIGDTSAADFIIPSPPPELLPGPAGNPFPIDQDVILATQPTISWSPSARAERYDFYLWPDSTSKPSTPTAPNRTDSYYQPSTPLPSGRGYRWSVTAKNLYGETATPEWKFSVRPLPNLRVDTIIVGEAWRGQPLTVSWTISNNGLGATSTPEWLDRIWLSPGLGVDIHEPEHVLLGAYGNVAALAPDERYTNTQIVQIPANLAGAMYLFVLSDIVDAYSINWEQWCAASHDFGPVAETNECDNFNYRQLTIGSTPAADLQLTSIIASPQTAFSNGTILVEWVVRNLGLATTEASTWSDGIYLSADTIYQAEDALLGTLDHTGELAPDSSYSASRYVALPHAIDGPRYVIVKTDIAEGVFEFTGESNNADRHDLISIVLAAPPDLVVDSVAAPTQASQRESIIVEWTVRDSGLGATYESAWHDRVYLSVDTLLDSLDAVLATIQHNGRLERSATYAEQRAVTLPADRSRSHYLLVQTDCNREVFEHTADTNNIRAAVQPLEILMPNLVVVSTVLPGSGLSGQSANFRWTVSNSGPGELIAGAWNDRIYLSTLPTFDSNAVVVLGTVARFGALNSATSYTVQSDFVIPNGLNGEYYAYVWTDWNDRLAEPGTADNNRRRSDTTLSIGLSPWPNLKVNSVQIPDSVTAGSLLTVSCIIADSGSAAVPAGLWTDRIFLSWNPTWYPPSNSEFAAVTRTGPLAVGASYGLTRTQIAAPALSGTYYVYVQTDANNSVYEHSAETDNILRSDPLVILPYPSVDLRLLSVDGPSEVSSGSSFTFQHTVQNIGRARTLVSMWSDAVYLSTDTALDVGTDLQMTTMLHVGTVEAGQTYTNSRILSVPNGLAGSYFLITRVDEYGAVNDSDRTNNVGWNLVPFTVVLTAPADLVVAHFSSDSTAIAGQPLPIQWTIHNIGSGTAATEVWHDAVYLSLNSVLDASDILLGNAMHSGSLLPDSLYIVNVALEIPSYASGNYYLILRTDHANSVYEHNGEHNNDSTRTLAVELADPADLIVTDVSLPDSAQPGDSARVTWTVANIGTNPAVGIMRDGVYLSTDSLWDIEDPLLNVSTRVVQILPGSVLSLNAAIDLSRTLCGDSLGFLQTGRDGEGGIETPLLPGVAPGSYYAIVRTDLRDNIRESNNGNNASASSSLLFVDVPPLIPGVPEALEMSAGQQRYFRVDVAAGSDLRLNLSCDVAGSLNELYASFGRIPTLADADAGGDQPFRADQELLLTTNVTGHWYVLVLARAVPVQSPVVEATLSATVLPLSLLSVTPDRGGSGGFVTCTMRGAGLDTTTIPCLSSEYFTIPGRVMDYSSRTEMKVIWDLRDLIQGIYDVRLTRSDGAEATLAAAFSVEPAVQSLEITALGPSVLRTHRDYTYELLAANTGNVDLADVRLLTSIPPGVAYKLGDSSEYATRASEVVVDVMLIKLPAGQSQSMELSLRTDQPLGNTAISVTALEPDSGLGFEAGYLGDALIVAQDSSATQGPVAECQEYEAAVIWDLAAACPGYVDYFRTYTAQGVPAGDAWGVRLEDDRVALFCGQMERDAEGQTLPGIGRVQILPIANLNSGPITLWNGDERRFEHHFSLRPQSDSSMIDFAQKVMENLSRRGDQDICYCDHPELDLQTGICVVCNDLCTSSMDNAMWLGFNNSPAPPPPGSLNQTISEWLGDNLVPAGDQELLTEFESGVVDDELWGEIERRMRRGRTVAIRIVASQDPNNITGPLGFGDPHWVAESEILPFTIRFENVAAESTVPAQVVRVTQPLDPRIDLNTFRLGNFGFANQSFPVPDNQAQHSQRLDLRDSLGLFVDVTAGVDVNTLQVFWIFESIDPNTGEHPLNPLLGFLPVNDSLSHRGEGFVSYTVRAATEGQPGDTISSMATITFDRNEPLATNDWLNTLDVGAPASQCDSGIALLDSTVFALRWSGGDDSSGCGISHYDIWCSINGEGYTRIAETLTDTFSTIYGSPFNGYDFFSIATDHVGNVERMKTTSEAHVEFFDIDWTRFVDSLVIQLLPGDGPRTTRLTWKHMPADSITRDLDQVEYWVYTRRGGSEHDNLYYYVASTPDTTYDFIVPTDPAEYFRLFVIAAYRLQAVAGGSPPVTPPSVLRIPVESGLSRGIEYTLPPPSVPHAPRFIPRKSSTNPVVKAPSAQDSRSGAW